MKPNNPEIERQLDKFSRLCCESLKGQSTADGDEFNALLKSLLMSGYARKPGASLQSELESRVKAECYEPAMHRGGALSRITAKMQSKFDDLVRWESRQPENRAKPKGANISSATDA